MNDIPQVNQPYSSFLSSLNNSHQTRNEEQTQENRSPITAYLHTNENPTKKTVETLKFF